MRAATNLAQSRIPSWSANKRSSCQPAFRWSGNAAANQGESRGRSLDFGVVLEVPGSPPGHLLLIRGISPFIYSVKVYHHPKGSPPLWWLTRFAGLSPMVKPQGDLRAGLERALTAQNDVEGDGTIPTDVPRNDRAR